MARSVNEEEFANRRNEILDAALQLIYTRGYDQMTIQDILEQLKISKGAFYHYFSSKQELLQALVERMAGQMEQVLLPMVFDQDLPALMKLQRFFDTGAQWKTARKELMINVMRSWYNDKNVLVREKVQIIVFHRVLPLLTRIIRQGVCEGVMNTPFPEQIAEVYLALANGMSNTLVELALQAADGLQSDLERARCYTQMYTNAMERVLGIIPGTLVMMDEATLKEWFG